MNAPRLLRPRGAAESLQCSVSQIRALTRRGELECVRVGTLPRYTEAALADYIQRNTRPVRTIAPARPRGVVVLP